MDLQAWTQRFMYIQDSKTYRSLDRKREKVSLSNYFKIINFYVFADYIQDKAIIINKMQCIYIYFFIYKIYICCIYKTEIGINLESI